MFIEITLVLEKENHKTLVNANEVQNFSEYESKCFVMLYSNKDLVEIKESYQEVKSKLIK